MEFLIHTSDTAPARSATILKSFTEEIGFLPNLAATMAESPTLLEGFATLRPIVRGGTLSGPERETIALVVSFENSCSYCMAAHSTFAVKEGLPSEALDALRSGEPPEVDSRLRALAGFTREVVHQRGFVPEEGVRALRGAGYTRPQLLEILAVIGWVSLANWAHNLTGAPVDEPFQAQAWTASESAAETTV